MQPTITLTLPIESGSGNPTAGNNVNKPISTGSGNSTSSGWNGLVAGAASGRKSPAKTLVLALVATLVGAAVWVV